MPSSVPLESAVILVVDDDPSTLTFVTTVLGRYGATVHRVASGKGAQQLATELERIDLLITDVMLPDGAGHALAHTLQATHPEMRIIVTSGYVSPNIESLSGARFLKKPFAPAALVANVREALA